MATKKTKIQKRLIFRQEMLDDLREALRALVKGGAKSYRIHNRELTRFDIPALTEEIRKMEEEVDALESQLEGCKARKAFGILPRDW